MIARLHHMAFRCRDSEETRAFYEEVVGLPFVSALEINTTKTGRQTRVLHTFFGMEDGSAVAFFEDPETPFEFKDQRDFDLHIALEADQAAVDRATKIAKERGLDFRGPSDHGFIRSIYLRDPNGYVVELTVKTPDYEAIVAHDRTTARGILEKWNAAKG